VAAGETVLADRDPQTAAAAQKWLRSINLGPL